MNLRPCVIAKRILATVFTLLLVQFPFSLTAQTSPSTLPAVRVDSSGHYLQTEDGKPFFWLADTAWELIHSTTREECSYYLHTRSRQGFTVIQTVVLAEFDGLNRPTPSGLRPFENNDPQRPNEAYFKRVVEIVDEAASVGLYVALLPTWGDKLTAPWGDGPRIFTNQNLPIAKAYGKYLGEQLRGRTNVLWILGGDRPPSVVNSKDEFAKKTAKAAGFPDDQDWTPIWREIAAGLAEGLGRTPLIAYHPNGGPESSSVFLHKEPWLSINGMQSGHGSGHDVPVWDWIARDFALQPAKPTIDLEPNYEDHPFNPWPHWNPASGYFRDYDVRKQTYRSVFAGGAGVTYGNHSIWQFAGSRNDGINHADRDWTDAMLRPAGRQMVFLRYLMESRPYFSRVPDQTLLVTEPGKGGLHLQATRDRAGSFAFVYFPVQDQGATIDLGKLRAEHVRAWWYDPRTGIATLIGEMDGGVKKEFTSPSYGPDWVLVLDDVSAGFPLPGLAQSNQ